MKPKQKKLEKEIGKGDMVVESGAHSNVTVAGANEPRNEACQ